MGKNNMKIILGSQSKGRKKMLEEMGVEFEIMPADIDEKAIRLKDPKELVLVIARAKADALKPRISEPAILITSDQVVVWQGKIREKPENGKEAR
ncbi:Maf family protein, partial [Patescibacteria group bacterium]|nr:Maf family protein [Patescibacteria group bacterium]